MAKGLRLVNTDGEEMILNKVYKGDTWTNNYRLRNLGLNPDMKNILKTLQEKCSEVLIMNSVTHFISANNELIKMSDLYPEENISVIFVKRTKKQNASSVYELVTMSARLPIEHDKVGYHSSNGTSICEVPVFISNKKVINI